jgi:hypothetical protein
MAKASIDEDNFYTPVTFTPNVEGEKGKTAAENAAADAAATGLSDKTEIVSSELTKLPTETNTQFLARKIAARDAERVAAVAKDPLLNKSVMPDAPAGYEYKWIGGTNTGKYQLYKLPASDGSGGSGDGSGGSGSSTGLNGVNGKIITAETRDAFSVLTALFTQYNLGSLAGTLQKLMEQGFTAEEASTKLKYDSGFINGTSGERWNDAYTTRFAGNKARLSKGLNALTEAEYVYNENSYAETIKAYGLNNMLSTDRYANEKKFAEYIANDLSPKEFKDRIDLAATRVINMDPAIQKNFQEYYPAVTKTDLISYFLAPDESLPLLQTKVTASEIGAAANQQGFNLGGTRAEEFAKLGVTKGQAQNAYANVAEVLPGGMKLSNIYNEEMIQYSQTNAEDEFLKQDAEAKLKRNRLASKERAMFGGDSGLSSQFSSLGKSIQGKY